MENIQRDNLIDQLQFIIAEVRRRPKEAYFAVPEIAVVEIDKKWMEQVHKSTIARQLKLQKEAEKRKEKKDNI
jgi:hypothetical protein